MLRSCLRCVLALLGLALLLAACGPGEPEEATAPVEEEAAPETADAGKAPKIHFPVTVLDLGVVGQGQTATGAFVVQNTGEADLALERAKGS